MTLLKVSELSKSYGGVHAARNVSFDLNRGELVALIGPNGAGKSTTFSMVGGQLTPDHGTIRLDGLDVTGMSPQGIFRQGVGRTFQVATIFSSMTVVENVQTAMAAHRGRSRAALPNAKRLFREEALEILSLTHMADFADRLSSTLSYGDVKRAELAIALIGETKLLLMDEPTAGMAPRERAGLMDLVSRLAAERNMGVLFTEHDMDSVFTHADRILVLVRGQIIAEGSPEEVRQNDHVKKVYLGESGSAAAQQAKKAR
ncbi:ABC transporter ATP-binding protein [Tardiphaga sp. 866_E4_N2_1]|jgi:branched-chain amino acid transport system ATP-binding protein|uniref:ABC transporter ATP-binding protein n=1 Tax=unclassified Tardiphaga TaxID=2631404 RepID=UPI003F20AB0B